MVGTRWTNQIRVLAFAISVSGTLNGRTMAVTKWQGLSILSDGVYLVIIRITVARSEGRTAKDLLPVARGNLQQLLESMIRGRDG